MFIKMVEMHSGLVTVLNTKVMCYAQNVLYAHVL